MMQRVIYDRSSFSGISLIKAECPGLNEHHLACRAFKRLLYYFGIYVENKVIVKIHASSINPVDTKFLYGDKLPSLCLPFIRFIIDGAGAGIDFAGTIECIPKDQNCPFQPGDKVYGFAPPLTGALSQFAKIPVGCIAAKPSNVDFSASAALPLVGVSAIQILNSHKLVRDSHVLVIGSSGGVGNAALQIAKAKGFNVSAICSVKSKGLSSSADTLICYDDLSSNEELCLRMKTCTETYGKFDLVIDTVSSMDSRDKNAYHDLVTTYHMLSSTGCYINTGGSTLHWFFAHVRRILGFNLFPKQRELFWIHFDAANDLQELTRLIEAGDLKVNVGNVYQLRDAGKAFDDVSRRQFHGKAVVEIPIKI